MSPWLHPALYPYMFCLTLSLKLRALLIRFTYYLSVLEHSLSGGPKLSFQPYSYRSYQSRKIAYSGGPELSFQPYYLSVLEHSLSGGPKLSSQLFIPTFFSVSEHSPSSGGPELSYHTYVRVRWNLSGSISVLLHRVFLRSSTYRYPTYVLVPTYLHFYHY